MAKKGKKKSGGKKSKLDKMTEEERILYLEQKTLQEEEQRKKKEEQMMRFLKMKLQKEENNSKFNLHKLNTQWREIMRQSKSSELKKDIEILSQTFERVVDRKKAVLESLSQDLHEAEEQYSMALRSHLQHVDRLIDLQNSRIFTLQSEFDEEAQILKKEYDIEREKIMEQSQKELNDLQDIVFSLEKSFQDKEAEALSEFQSLRDEIKTKTQQMTLFLWQRQTWIDDFLQWDPDEFGGIDQLFISPTRIWVSDVIFQNSVDEFEQLKDTTIIKALVLYSGQVYFFRPTLKSTTCKMSVRYFPYDAQVCSFQVGSWMLSEDQVDIQVLAFDSAVSGFVTHHEWHLAERRTFRCSMTVPVNMGTLQKNMSFPFLEFLFLFQRKPEFFEKNLIVPTALICALSIVAFLLPNESGEKIGFSITVFLSLCVNLVVITSYVPASSESFPIIGQYYLTCIFLVAVSIVLTTCILSVHYFGDQYFIKPLPVTVKKIFFEVLAPMVGMQCLRRCSNCITLKSSRNRFQSKCKTTTSAPANRSGDILQRWRRMGSNSSNRHMYISAANDGCTNFTALRLGKVKANHQPTVLRNSKVSTYNHVDSYFHLNNTSHDDSTTYDGNGIETSPEMNQIKTQLGCTAITETASLTSVDETFPNVITGNNLNKNAAKASPDSKSMNLPTLESSNDSSAIPAPAYQQYSPESNLKFAAGQEALADSNSTVSATPFSANSLLALPRRSSEIGSCSCIEINPVFFETKLNGGADENKHQYESMMIDEKVSKMTNSHSAPTESTVADVSAVDDLQKRKTSKINREKSSSCSGLLSSFDDLRKSLQKIEHYLESVSKASEKKKKKCVTIEEWKLLSRILDRIFAIAYGLTTLLLTCYFFLQARSGEVELAKECKV